MMRPLSLTSKTCRVNLRIIDSLNLLNLRIYLKFKKTIFKFKMTDYFALENLKKYQRFYHNEISSYYKLYKTTSTKEFTKLWDKFISISEVIYIFEDYPFSYNIFLEYNKKQNISSYKEYKEVYEHCVDLLYTKMGVYFK